MNVDDESVELSISEMASLLHTSKSTLRYYEKEGLIKPERATSSGYRRYSFQSLIELSDIMLYRSLGIPVKEVRTLLDAPIAQTDLRLNEAEDDLLGQLRQITDTLEKISSRRKRLRLYYATSAAGHRMVTQPEVETLFSFDLSQPEAMGAYISDPESVHYAAFFPRATEPSVFIDGALTPYGDSDHKVIWKRPAKQGRWLECLMKTDYSLTGNNDLDVHSAYLRDQGFAPGQVVAEYLTFDWDEERQARVDYYRAWIEALDA